MLYGNGQTLGRSRSVSDALKVVIQKLDICMAHGTFSDEILPCHVTEPYPGRGNISLMRSLPFSIFKVMDHKPRYGWRACLRMSLCTGKTSWAPSRRAMTSASRLPPLSDSVAGLTQSNGISAVFVNHAAIPVDHPNNLALINWRYSSTDPTQRQMGRIFT